MHKQAIKHKQAIIGGGYLFTENACFFLNPGTSELYKKISPTILFFIELRTLKPMRTRTLNRISIWHGLMVNQLNWIQM